MEDAKNFRSLMNRLASYSFTVMDPVVHSCFVSIGEELQVFTTAKDEHRIKQEFDNSGHNIWTLGDVLLGYKVAVDVIQLMSEKETSEIMEQIIHFKHLSPQLAVKLAANENYKRDSRKSTTINREDEDSTSQASNEYSAMLTGHCDSHTDHHQGNQPKQNNNSDQRGVLRLTVQESIGTCRENNLSLLVSTRSVNNAENTNRSELINSNQPTMTFQEENNITENIAVLPLSNEQWVKISVFQERATENTTCSPQPSLQSSLNIDSRFEPEAPATQTSVVTAKNKETVRKPTFRSRRLACGEQGCSYMARSNCELIQHKRKHTGDRPIPCEWEGCSKRFKDNSTYRLHYRSIHLKRKDYMCTVQGCGLRFGCAKSRNRHAANKFLHARIMSKTETVVTTAPSMALKLPLNE